MEKSSNHIREIRQLIELFESYGIELTGAKKFKNFYDQLKMDEIYVHGLIFEVECLLQKEINCNWSELACPRDVIEKALVSA